VTFDRNDIVIRHLLERHAAERGAKEFASFESGERWSYENALESAYRAADVLRGAGVRRNDHVALLLPNGAEYLRAWFGVNALGAVLVPINAAYRGAMLRHVLTDSDASLVVTTPELSERITELGLDVPIMEARDLVEGAMREPASDGPIEAWDIHHIGYTSGTTGTSKGAVLHHAHLPGNAMMFLKWGRDDDTFLCDLPLFHSGGISMVYAALQLGARSAIRPLFSGSRYLEVVRETEASVSLLVVGSMLSFFRSQPRRPDDADTCLRWVCAAPVPEDADDLRDRFGLESIATCFSMTEVPCPIVDWGPLRKTGSCGRLREGFDARLVDENDQDVPEGSPGELMIRAQAPWSIATGYYGRTEESRQAWRNGWFHTGDLLRRDPEGDYFFVDRAKDSIRRRGENISSFEVEREVRQFPGVKDAACIGVPTDYTDEDVKVFIIAADGSTIDPVTLFEFLIGRMPYFMVPRFVEFVDELPRTPTMKVQKYRLRDRGHGPDVFDREAIGLTVRRDY
jgi:crotonobetaine/carnitine-CoA ligase